MKQIYTEELKVIQMDILTAFDNFCTKNNLTYSMSSGTLLGAVRHKGYIPWDDDIDVYMLREEYNKMIKLFPKKYKDKYVLACMENDSEWTLTFANLYDDTTVLIEEANSKVIGVNIDIFPIDDVPDTEEEWCKFKNKLRILSRLKGIKAMKWRKGRALHKNLFLLAMKILTFFIPRKALLQYYNKYAQSYNGRGSEWVYECSYGTGFNHPFFKSIFNNTSYMTFEDRKYKGFDNYDEFLRKSYGDYMQFPPKEEQVSHHSFTAYYK